MTIDEMAINHNDCHFVKYKEEENNIEILAKLLKESIKLIKFQNTDYDIVTI